MAKQPKIRFKGFTEEWKEKKISDLLLERIDMAPQNDAYPLMAFVANKGIVSKGDRYDRSALIKDAVNKPYKRTSYGDFIYSSNNLEAGSIGMNIYGNASISPVYSIFAPKGDNNPYYLGVRLAMPDIIHEMVRCRQGVVYGQWKIHEDEFLNISVKMPKPDEQKAISQVIIDLTTTISQREKELEKLKNIKRALLEKLFPQDGQSIPAIRFKGFEGKWNEGQIGDAFRERDERSGDGELLSVTINSGIRRAKEMERTFTTGDLNKYKVVRKGDIAYNTMRMWQGACGVSEYSGIVSPAYTIAMPREGHVSAFYAYYFKSNRMLHDFRIYSQGLTSDTWNLKYPSFAKIKAFYPKNTEQRKIADTMLNLDCVISLRERQLTLLKHSKQALLEQMFVNE